MSAHTDNELFPNSSMPGQESLGESTSQISSEDSLADVLKESMSNMVLSQAEAQGHALDHEIDVMLQKIEEYLEITELIRCDTKTCVNTTLPGVSEKALELQSLFERIDHLEVFVNNVDEILRKLEAQAQEADNHFSTFASIKKKLFGALASLGRKHTDTSPQYHQARGEQARVYTYEPVELFSTKDYFPCTDEEIATTAE